MEAHYLCGLFPLSDDAGNVTGLGFIGADITERRKLERRLAEVNQQLSAETRLVKEVNSDLETFAYNVSHDLRTPLRAVDGYIRIYLGKNSAGLTDESRQYLDQALQGAKQIGQLIDGFLTLSLVGNRKTLRSTVKLDEAAREAIEELEEFGDGQQIEFQIEELPPCEGDRELLKILMKNLISNAIKFTRGRTDPVIVIGSVTHAGDNHPIYFVRDNGVGFDMQHIEKLFEVFERLHRDDEFEGSGVGLATAERIVHKHGGKIWAEAKPDEGATLFFTIGKLENGIGQAA